MKMEYVRVLVKLRKELEDELDCIQRLIEHLESIHGDKSDLPNIPPLPDKVAISLLRDKAAPVNLNHLVQEAISQYKGTEYVWKLKLRPALIYLRNKGTVVSHKIPGEFHVKWSLSENTLTTH
jgi:hypothetical protein